jgi:phosphate transport system protein
MDVGLEKLSNLLLEMADLSQKSVSASVEAYNKNSVSQVFEWSEKLRDLHNEVGELAVEIIARYQPVASDLRFVRGSMDISYGFTRFGRYAYDIAQVLEAFENISNCDHTLIQETTDTTQQMIRMSIESFTKKDTELAERVKKMDDLVDDKYRKHIFNVIHGQGFNVQCVVSTTLILRYLERIADHSACIADSVIYIITGH